MSRLKIIPLCEIKRNPRPRYLVEGLIPAQDITVVWGEPKSGKTFWVLDLGLHVAMGRPYRGKQVEQGSVVYCALEGVPAVPDRLEAMSKNYGKAMEAAARSFWFCPDRFTFRRPSHANTLIHAIMEALGAELPKLVIIDTLNRSLEGSENSDSDMTYYTRCIEDIGEAFQCSVIVIHHCGVSGDKPRGHTSLTGTCAAQLKVARTEAGPIIPGSSLMISTTVQFMKDGPEGSQIFSWIQPVSLGIDETGKEVMSCCVIEAPQPSRPDKMPNHIAKALIILQTEVSRSEDGKVNLSDWREKCKLAKLGRTKESSRTAFYKALDKLRQDGMIYIEGQSVFLAKKGNGAS